EPESFGLTFMEAMIAGIPVVTSAMGGAQELIDESVGRLCLAGDSSSVARALGQLIRGGHLRRKLGQAGAERVAEQFDPQRMIQRLYDTLAAGCTPQVVRS